MKCSFTTVRLCRVIVVLQIFLLQLLLLTHEATASKYLPDVPEDVRQTILQWEAKLGKRVYLDGTTILRNPYQEETFNALLAGLKHEHPAARVIAAQLLYWSVRDLAVPEEAIARLTTALQAAQADAPDLTKVEHPELIEPSWIDKIHWIIAYKKLDPAQQLAALKEILFVRGARNWALAPESVDLLVRIGNDEAKEILSSRLAKNAGPTFRTRLQLALERIEINRKLDQVPDNTEKIRVIAEMLRHFRPAPGSEAINAFNTNENALSFYLIRKLEVLGTKEAEDVLWAIIDDESSAVLVRRTAEEAATGVPIREQTGYRPKRPQRQ